MKGLKKLLLSVTIILVTASAFNAQETIPAEKKKLIGELIALTEVDKSVANVMNLILTSYETSYQSTIKSTLSKSELPQADKDEMERRLITDQTKFLARFRERFQKEISPQTFVEETMYPLYAKFFTESELTDIVNFYKSPTGQKMVRQMPELMAESFKISEEKFVPRVQKIADEIVDEQLREYRSAPPASAKNH